MTTPRVYILCNFARFSSLYTSWLDKLPVPYEVVEQAAARWQPPEDCGLVVTHMHYRWEEVSAIRRITESQRIPVLVLADGILEYRNLYEHPELADGCIFQPLMGHKLACLGRSQARVVESWGNVGKCEVVGLPRLDPFLIQQAPPIRTAGPFRLLIATATTPYFNAQQRESVVESLLHFKQRLEANSRVNGRKTEVTWRLTAGLERDLGLESGLDSKNRPSLSQAIDEADAVITTPSTLYLESALKRRPTAILDFYNSPNFVSAAWTINAPRHFNAILSELANPPAPKLLFQETELHDQLACHSPATPRLIELMLAMLRYGEDSRRAGHQLQLPLRMLADPLQGFAAIEPEFELARLFPENETFASQDLARVQVELNLARERLGSLPEELEEMRQRAIELNGKNHQLTKQLREQKERIQKLRSAYLLMRKRKQKGLSQPAVSTSTVADLPRPNQVSSDSTESNLPETTPTQLVPPQRPTPSLEQPAESDSGNVLPT